MKRFLVLFALISLVGISCTDTKQEEKTEKAAPQEETTAETQPKKAEKAIQPEQETGNVVARINGRPIYEEDLGGNTVESLIDYEVMYQLGLMRGLDETKDVQSKVRAYKKRLVVNALQREISDQIAPDTNISEEELEAYYNKNIEKFRNFRIVFLRTDDKQIASEIAERAKNEEDLKKIASDYPTGKVSLRPYIGNRYNDLFEEKEAGEVQMVQESDGYRVLKLIEIQEFPLSKAKPSIKQNILAQRGAQAVHDYVRKMINEKDIQIEVLERPNDQADKQINEEQTTTGRKTEQQAEGSNEPGTSRETE